MHLADYVHYKKKRPLRALPAHNERTYTSGTSCAGTRRVPLVGCSSSGSQNITPTFSGIPRENGTKSELDA